jgi:hypothetical protein
MSLNYLGLLDTVLLSSVGSIITPCNLCEVLPTVTVITPITPYSLRSTMIFRPEDGVWKVVHRHADPITTAQPVESVIQE